VFNIINYTSILEDSCFYSNLPAEAVTIAILKYASFHSCCCFTNRKFKSFKQTVFLSEPCALSKVTTSVQSAVFQPRHRPTIILLLIYCSVDNMLFKISPAVQVCQVATVVMETTQLVLSQFHLNTVHESDTDRQKCHS